ncbi:MAG: PorV/PorQ family protein [bacterium]
MRTLSNTFFLLMVILFIGMGNDARGQITKKAQVGFRFLENPIAADVVGRGSAGVATTLSSSGVFWNPSLLGWIPQNVDLSLHHTTGIADISYNALAGAVQINGVGVLGISLLTMDYGTFYGTRRAANSTGYIETGEFSPTAFAVGLAFSQKVSNRFSYGVHLKYAQQDLGAAWVAATGSSISDPALEISERQYVQKTLAMDVGAYYDFLYRGIRFGACLQNISREIRYENEAFPLPFAVSFGATVEPLQFFSEEEKDVLILCIESRHPRDFNEKLKVGAEYRFLDIFTARAGYATNYTERGFSAGIGIRYDVAGFPVRADYAYQAFGVFGAVHYLSLAVSY